MGSSGSRQGLTAARRRAGSLTGSVVAALFAQALGLWGLPAFASSCNPGTVDIRGPDGRAQFSVELAETPDQQQIGLMYREHMPSSAGMLFVFERPKRAGFWMRNTLIPLDMLFADSTGRITRVHANAIPHDETLIDGGEGVKFVLEINGGLAARLGIRAGAEMRHPSIEPSNAAWPCAED